MSYLNINEVESALIGLAAAYPSLCELITLPHPSIEGRTIHAVRVGKGTAAGRDAVLLTGGVHAREWGSSEICVNVAADLCEAYSLGTGLGYGGQYFTAAEIQAIVDGLNLIILADANPDGRDFSQNSDAMWRRNRNPAESGGNPSCIGVDLNRNQDFLWDFPVHFDPTAPVQTSADPCSTSQTYRGSGPASEPETQNLVWLMDTYPRLRWYLDLHSHGQSILHSWGDDEHQQADAAQSFTNAAFDGDRGVSGDAYGEYLPGGDLAAILDLANSFRDALQAVRGRTYSVAPAYQLYPTSGANDDYAYGRHFANPAQNSVLSYTIEWGTQFQPPWSEMEQIVADVSSGILGFCLTALCQAETVAVLQTPTLVFNDVPEGETTVRAVTFQVSSCQPATFQIVAGPTVTAGPGSFGTLPTPNNTLPAAPTPAARPAWLWISFTGTNDGDITTGSVTVQHVESGQQWVIPISANTINRPTVAAVLALDQSGSMTQPSGLSSFPSRNDVLKFAAPVFVNLLQEDNGLGILAFDHDAYNRMPIATAGPPGAFDPTRNTALGVIAAHSPNPAGNTAIGDAVDLAQSMLNAAPGFDHQAMIVFTDGHETASQYIADVAPLINERVFAIGLGTADQIQPTALTALTNGTGGFLLLTGALGPDDLFRLSKYYLQILAGVTNQDIVLDPEGALKPGQIARIPFFLNEADVSVDAILLPEANLPLFRFYLETPNGDLVDPGLAAASPAVDYITASGVSFYRFSLPVPLGPGARAGKWHAILEVDEKYYKRYLATLEELYEQLPGLYQQVLAHGVRYSVSVQSYSGLRLQAHLNQSANTPGATLTLRGILSEYGLPVGADRAHLWAELDRPDGTSGLLQLAETQPDSGIYEGHAPAPIPGVYHFRLLAEGKTLRGRDFSREHLLTGAVWSGGDNPPPSSGDDPGSGPGGDPDRWCRFLACLVEDQALGAALERLGVDRNALVACLKEFCRQ